MCTNAANQKHVAEHMVVCFRMLPATQWNNVPINVGKHKTLSALKKLGNITVFNPAVLAKIHHVVSRVL